MARDGARIWDLERLLRSRGVRHVAGVDEAGRGPLAGPVVTAAVVFPAGFEHPGIDDSKVLSPERREELAAVVRAAALCWAVVEAGPDEIDRVNILQATLRAMADAVAALAERPDYVLVDGNRLPALLVPGEAVVGGDARVGCIAAASILAKTHRDRIMDGHHERWPAYGFRTNRGYGTPGHLAALRAHGPCPIHRRTFRGVLSG
jgi:ribonuclease HII